MTSFYIGHMLEKKNLNPLTYFRLWTVVCLTLLALLLQILQHLKVITPLIYCEVTMRNESRYFNQNWIIFADAKTCLVRRR